MISKGKPEEGGARPPQMGQKRNGPKPGGSRPPAKLIRVIAITPQWAKAKMAQNMAIAIKMAQAMDDRTPPQWAKTKMAQNQGCPDTPHK